MSDAKQCDKCGKVVPKDEDFIESDKPDYVAFIRGTVIVEYKDLCETCMTRVVTNSDKHIQCSTRVRKTSE